MACITALRVVGAGIVLTGSNSAFAGEPWSADGNIVSQENVHCVFKPRRVSNVIINEDEIVISGRDGLLSQDRQQFRRTFAGQSRDRGDATAICRRASKLSSSWRSGRRASISDKCQRIRSIKQGRV